jgi:hypothetical protein
MPAVWAPATARTRALSKEAVLQNICPRSIWILTIIRMWIQKAVLLIILGALSELASKSKIQYFFGLGEIFV